MFEGIYFENNVRSEYESTLKDAIKDAQRHINEAEKEVLGKTGPEAKAFTSNLKDL